MHAVEGRFIDETSLVAGIEVAYVEFGNICTVDFIQDEFRLPSVLCTTARSQDVVGAFNRQSACRLRWPVVEATFARSGANSAFAITQFG